MARDSTDDLDKDTELQTMRALEKYYIKGSQDSQGALFNCLISFTARVQMAFTTALSRNSLGHHFQLFWTSTGTWKFLYLQTQYLEDRGNFFASPSLSFVHFPLLSATYVRSIRDDTKNAKNITSIDQLTLNLREGTTQELNFTIYHNHVHSTHSKLVPSTIFPASTTVTATMNQEPTNLGGKCTPLGSITEPRQEDSAVDNLPIFFHLPDAFHGEFCQWFPSIFTVSTSKISSLIDDSYDTEADSNTDDQITFNCAEQFMMYCKAGRFNGRDTQRRVLATSSPKEQKHLGRQVNGFYDPRWDEVKSDVVIAGSIAKFSRNRKLRGKLLATGDRLLVEASSQDPVWGIGYSAKHAMAHRKHWGENRLTNISSNGLRQGGACGASKLGIQGDPYLGLTTETPRRPGPLQDTCIAHHQVPEHRW
ncbi:hypothetical protein V494_05343 [Pseudogymnoascus sp. VKM F-4513 (FW-928)]|nr:hypothetical protein V494_05343 [Pseudogymnoascus sp. VKM F-4513 (FW-928)]